MVSSVELERAQGVGHARAASAMIERVAGVGLGLAGVEVGDPPHRQSGQVGDLAARVAGDGQRQGADGGGLVDDHQHGAVLGLSLSNTSRSFGSLLGSGLSKTFFPAGVTAVAWCSPLPTSRPRKTSMSLVVDHVHSSRGRVLPGLTAAPAAGIHVTKSLPARAGAHAPNQRSADASGPGDTTFPIMIDRGLKSCRARRPGASLRRPRKR